mmetsp:Transcript_10780/g.16933  ORF Transcript_10780/g.16933 Transcript_10780/m.16933 type:complete len:234 (-) Transcript_10780:465-1166(-)
MKTIPPPTLGRMMLRSQFCSSSLSPLLSVLLELPPSPPFTALVQKGPGYATSSDSQPELQKQSRPDSKLHAPWPLQFTDSEHLVSHSNPKNSAEQRHARFAQAPWPLQFLSRPVLGIPSHPLHVLSSPPQTPHPSRILGLNAISSHPALTSPTAKCERWSELMSTIPTSESSNVSPVVIHENDSSSKTLPNGTPTWPVEAIATLWMFCSLKDSLSFTNACLGSWISRGVADPR